MSTEAPRTRIFGTDGIRGRYGEDWLTPDAVAALGRAVGRVWERRGAGRRVLVGHDGRASGPTLERALARGLATGGFATTSAGLITTPGLAHLGRGGDFVLTAMISASHNPAHDNGIKLFGTDGEKLADELEHEIEDELLAHPALPAGQGPDAGPAPDPSLAEAYREHLARAAAGLDLSGWRVALDCANGGGSRVGPRVLEDLGASVLALACSPDGSNINAGCGSTHPEALQAAVRESGARLGIALDGDGDRCVLVDEHGELVHGDAILMLVARHAVAHSRWKTNRIVATVMSNRGLHRALREVGVSIETVGVGDRRVVEALHREGLALGGEQSGHIVFGAENDYIGDGLYTALRVLSILAEEGASLAQLAAPYRPFPQVLINVPVASKPALESLASVRELAGAIERELGEDGRVLLRYSGTEPLARVMVEGPDDAWIQERARALAELIRAEIGS